MRHLLHDRRTRAALYTATALLAAAAVYSALSATHAGVHSSANGTAGGIERAAAGKQLPAGAAITAPQPLPASPDGQGSSSDAATDDRAASELDAALPPVLDSRRYLVRTGDMSVVVTRGGVAEAAARIVGLTTGYGGYVLSSQLSTLDDGSRPFADVTVRIPARLYDQAIRRFGALGRVQRVQTSAEDVTGQYVDLRARLAHQRKVERRLVGFLERAATVEQALAVQTRIDTTELRIEQLIGQLKALREQVVYGTLTISVTEKSHVVPPAHHNSFTTALLSSWRHLLAGLEAIIVGLGAVLPFVLLLAVLGGLVWFGTHAVGRVRRHAPSEQ